MKRDAIVSGAEQGLGAEIRAQLQLLDYRVWNLPGDVCRGGKVAIDNWVAQSDLEHLRVVVNNFGINHLSWIGETPAEDEDILRVNVMSPYWLINALAARGHGMCRVVNIASQTYRIPQRTTAIYCASKAALVQMTRVMARELAPAGWVINALAPGKIMGTEMQRLTDLQVLQLRGWDKERADTYATGLIPMERFTTPEEVALAVINLLHMPKYVNGTVVDMTGGL